jgi:predicted dehydrogenase
MNPIKIAVVGEGSIARAHIDRVQRCSETRLVAIAVMGVASEEGLHPSGQATDVPLFPCLEDCLGEGGVDAVILACSGSELVRLALLCVAANVPILMEKLTCLDEEDGNLLRHALSIRPVPCLMGHYRLHSPVISLARKTIDSGLLGELVSVQGNSRFFPPSDYYRAAEWRTARLALTVPDTLAHEIACLRYLCGDIVQVQSMLGGVSRADAGVPIPQTRCISLRFANGVVGSLMMSDLPRSLAADAVLPERYQDEDQCVITGRLCSLSLPDLCLRRYTASEEGTDWMPFETSQLTARRLDPMMEQLRHFCRVVQGEQEPLVSLNDGIENLRVTEAVAIAFISGSSEWVVACRSPARAKSRAM